MSDEKTDALKLAERILDRHNADPDDDLALLARQLLRATERAEQAEDLVGRLAEPKDGPLLTCPWCGANQTGRITNAQISHLIECGDRERARLAEALRALAEAIKPFLSGGEWGTWKAYMVHGPETKEHGIAAAKQITAWQVALDVAVTAVERARKGETPP